MKRVSVLVSVVPLTLLALGLLLEASVVRSEAIVQSSRGDFAPAAIADQPPSFPKMAQAKPKKGGNLFSPPPGQDAPKSARGAGRRRTEKICPKVASILEQTPPLAEPTTAEAWPTILTPTDAKGLTIASHPTFLVYIPETTAKNLEFALVDITQKGEQIIYQMQMPIMQKPGIVRISVPDTIPDLEVGKEYEWYVTLACKNGRSDPNDYLIKGKIQRQAETAIATMPKHQSITIENIQLYGEKGLWFDVSAALALLRRNQPQDPAVKSLWVQLLRDVDLEELSDFAVLN